jgi:Bacterial regulatory helix-turn-helix proteins, AraC family
MSEPVARWDRFSDPKRWDVGNPSHGTGFPTIPDEAVYRTHGCVDQGLQYGPSRRCDGHPVMQRNLGRPLTTREIAAAAGTSERSLRRQFQRFTGQSPIAFHRHLRLEAIQRQAPLHASTFSGSVAVPWKTRVVSPDAACRVIGNGTRASRSVVKLPNLPSTARASVDSPGTAAPEVAPSDANFNCNTCARGK